MFAVCCLARSLVDSVKPFSLSAFLRARRPLFSRLTLPIAEARGITALFG